VSSAPRTSFVIAARNAAATLAQTLHSVLAQSDGDWEALIVDDDSTDATPALIAEQVRRDARFFALRGRGAGVAAARNIALQQARGRCVVFLDSDDWIAPTHLERLHAALDAAPGATAAYCDRHRVMPDGERAPAHGEPQIAQRPFEMFARTCAVAIHAVLVERAAVTRAGGFDPTLRTCEDWDLWQRIARQGGRWVHVAEPLAFYRTSDNSLSQDMQNVLADAAVVVHRGFAAASADVDAHAAHAAGASRADGATPERALAYFTLWCCAVDAVRGRARPHGPTGLAALPASREHARHIAIALVDAATVGLLAVPKRLAARWPEHGPHITALIGALGAIWQNAAAARRVQYEFERLLLQYDDLAAPRPLSLTLGLRVDLNALTPVTPPPGADRFYVYLCDGGHVLAVVEAGALGTFAPRDWMELAAHHLGWERVTALTRRQVMGSITLRGLTDATRLLGRALRRSASSGPSWRPVLALAARDALRALAAPSASAGGHRDALHRLRVTVSRICADMPPPAHRASLQTALDDEPARRSMGRLVMITFDHRDQDAADLAGGRPEAQRHVGEPAASMDAKKIAALAAEGARFGIRWVSHGDADGLTTRALAEALLQAQQGLAQWTSTKACALVLPAGSTDQRLQGLAAACGMHIGFGAASAAASLADDAMGLPRIEVRADMAPEEFVLVLEACR
jgi:Glycosyl transferase family 2